MNAEHEQYFRSVFEEFDEDGDGVMTKEELRVLMAALGENLNEAMIDELVSQIDQDSNGAVDSEEFLHLMQMYPTAHAASCAAPTPSVSLDALSGFLTATGTGQSPRESSSR